MPIPPEHLYGVRRDRGWDAEPPSRPKRPPVWFGVLLILIAAAVCGLLFLGLMHVHL